MIFGMYSHSGKATNLIQIIANAYVCKLSNINVCNCELITPDYYALYRSAHKNGLRKKKGEKVLAIDQWTPPTG